MIACMIFSLHTYIYTHTPRVLFARGRRAVIGWGGWIDGRILRKEQPTKSEKATLFLAQFIVSTGQTEVKRLHVERCYSSYVCKKKEKTDATTVVFVGWEAKGEWRRIFAKITRDRPKRKGRKSARETAPESTAGFACLLLFPLFLHPHTLPINQYPSRFFSSSSLALPCGLGV